MNDSPSWDEHSGRQSLFQKAKVLVIDDSITMRQIMEHVLREQGIENIALAVDGLDGLKKAAEFSPDLIVLDVAMPTMDGLQFCEIFRNTPSTIRDIPMIITTGLGKSDERMRALRAGVSSILYKPINPRELIDRIYLHLQESYLLAKLSRDEAPTADDVKMAASMQALLIPNATAIEACKASHHIDLHHTYQASQLFGGDYWSILSISRHVMAIFIADFSGHGGAAAIYTFRLHKYLREYVSYYGSPSEVLEGLNRAFVTMLPAGQYLTCSLVFVDSEHHTLSYAAAAHPPMLLHDRHTVHALDCSGAPLGAYSDATYQTHEKPFSAGDVLILYSDALIEPSGDRPALFTTQALMETVKIHTQDHHEHKAKAIHSAIHDRINQSHHLFEDDLTLLCLERL